MEHGAIHHAEREIGRAPAASVEVHVHSREHPFAVEAATPVHAEVVPLAGHRHVVVAVETELGGTAGHVRGQSREARPLRRLRLLAAECPAHAPALAHHRRVGYIEHAGDEVLHFRRMLGRGADPHFVVLTGDRERGLPLQIEVLLSADAHAAFEPVGGGGDCRRRIPAPELVGGEHLGAVGQTVVHGDAGGDRLDVDAGATGRAAGRITGLGDHRKDYLPVKEHLAGGEDRIVAEGGAAIVRAWNVRGGQHRQHAGAGAHRAEIERTYRPARGSRSAGRDVHGAGRLGQVVDVGGRPPHVACGAVVREGEADARAVGETGTVRERGVGDRRVRLHRRNAGVDSGSPAGT